MTDLLLVGLSWLLLAVIAGLFVGVFVAIREGLRALADRREERRLDRKLTELADLLQAAEKAVAMLERPPKPVSPVVAEGVVGQPEPAPAQVTTVRDSVKQAVEEALRDIGGLPEGWK